MKNQSTVIGAEKNIKIPCNMKNLYESILSSTRTGIRGMIMKWMEEMDFLSNISINAFVFDSSKYKNTEDIIKISKKGKINISNDVSGSILLYNPYISRFNAKVPEYVNFGECPSMTFSVNTDYMQLKQLPSTCCDINIYFGGDVKPFSISVKRYLNIIAYNKKIIIPEIKINAHDIPDMSPHPSGMPRIIQKDNLEINIKGKDIDFDSLKNIELKNPYRKTILRFNIDSASSKRIIKHLEKLQEKEEMNSYLTELFAKMEGLSIIFIEYKNRTFRIAKDKKQGWQIIYV